MSRHEKEFIRFDPVAQEQIRALGDGVRELKQRVEKLESVLLRGMVLIVANLSAVIASLLQQLWRV